MFPSQARQSNVMGIQQLNNVAMNVVEFGCAIVVRPAELILRPWHGTRYFSPPVIFGSTMMMAILPIIAVLTAGVSQLIPGAQGHAPVGLFGILELAKLYFVLSLVHSARLWRRMIHMEQEMLSEYEGAPLPFFQLFPKSGSFWFTRIVLEPIFLFAAATVLGRLFIFQSGLTLYFQFAALMLAMKAFIGWYRAWEYLRTLMDTAFIGPIISKMLQNNASSDELATIHLSSFPENISPEMRQTALRHIARIVSGDPQGPGTEQQPKRGESNEPRS